MAPLTDVRADNMLPDWMDVAAKDVPKYAYDPARAKALLAEAGYPEGFSFKLTGIATAGGAPEADLLRQSYLAAVGLKMDFEYVETTVYNQRRNNGDFSLRVVSCPPSIPTRSSSATSIHRTQRQRASTARATTTPRSQRSWSRPCSTLDESMRKDLYGQAQKIVMEELPYLPTVQEARTGPAGMP